MSKFVILHKRKTPQIRLCCIMKVTKQTFATYTKEGVSRKYYTSFFIHIQPVKKINLCKFYSNWVISHLMSILISIFISGYHGKTTDFAKNSPGIGLPLPIFSIMVNGMIPYLWIR